MKRSYSGYGMKMFDDVPEDLSAKRKSVSVQTDKREQDKFQELFDGFTENQLRAVMNLLMNVVNQRKEEKMQTEEQEFKVIQSVHTVTPLKGCRFRREF